MSAVDFISICVNVLKIKLITELVSILITRGSCYLLFKFEIISILTKAFWLLFPLTGMRVNFLTPYEYFTAFYCL